MRHLAVIKIMNIAALWQIVKDQVRHTDLKPTRSILNSEIYRILIFVLTCCNLGSALDKKEESTTDVDFSYKDVSQLSEVTDDVYAESVADEDADLRDYNRLVQ